MMSQAYTNGLYYIKQVAEMTGMSKQVIRKWEERYGLIQPIRLENGYRMYSEKDISILLTVKELSEQGHSIKQAAALAKKKLTSINMNLSREQESTLHYKEWNDYVLQMLQKGAHCDELELTLILQQAYYQLGLDRFIKLVVIPFLTQVGSRWEKGEWSEYQEALSSLVVRDFLVQIRRNYQCRQEAPLIVGACLPYEQHEIPLHILLLQCMMKGWKTILIGASPAPGSIESLVQKLKPAKVLLSAVTTIPFEKDPHLVENLDQFAAENQKTQFYLGGAGAIQYLSDKALRAIYVTNSIEEIADSSEK
ncbi:MerR family transcriptional regulator [Bacillus sp. B190/17]|uniref:MerR family transcriptional regulator n=1 Tax=Bacillus lumedeiriae TaxID=3058829 RepID=A0ABW8IC55_9BACI